MAFQESTTFSFTPAQVCEALLDEEFNRQITQEIGGELAAFERQGDPSGPVTLTMVRTLPADRVPDFARRFVGDRLQVEQVETWSAPSEDGSRTGTVLIKVPVARATAEGHQEVIGQDGGTVLSMEGSISCKIPLVGGKLAQAVEPMVSKVQAQRSRALEKWLSR